MQIKCYYVNCNYINKKDDNIEVRVITTLYNTLFVLFHNYGIWLHAGFKGEKKDFFLKLIL